MSAAKWLGLSVALGFASLGCVVAGVILKRDEAWLPLAAAGLFALGFVADYVAHRIDPRMNLWKWLRSFRG